MRLVLSDLSTLDAIPKELKKAAAQTRPTIRLSLPAASTIITDCIIAYRSKRPDIKFKLLQTKEEPSADYRIFANLSETALTDLYQLPDGLQYPLFIRRL